MANVASELEALGRSGNLEGAEELLEELQSEFERANAELSTSLFES